MGLVVKKFGGTSVASLARWNEIAKMVPKSINSGNEIVLVCSAVSGVSSLLMSLVEKAGGGFLDAALIANLRGIHLDLAKYAEVSFDLVESDFCDIERMCLGLSLVAKGSYSVKAEVLAKGEIILTKMLAEWLNKSGRDVEWVDVRELLIATEEPLTARETLCYSGKFRPIDPDTVIKGKTVVTQGFIAGSPAGQTVLLGRGGSDTSAAILGSLLGAESVEIWTDVPGMFTANPHEIPEAQLILSMDYDEAQELATSGAKVLHPRCLDPVRDSNIPLKICWTERPNYPGTLITRECASKNCGIRAVSYKKNIRLLSLDAIGMWQEVGFASQIFDCIQRHGFGVDIISTSQSNVTVSIDEQGMSQASWNRMQSELSSFCRVHVEMNCASLSVVGKGIRRVLPTMAPLLAEFKGHTIHLMTLSASDLNLTFVIDQGQVEELAANIHNILLDHRQRNSEFFGAAWKDLHKESEAVAPHWWSHCVPALKALVQDDPIYVYDLDQIKARIIDIQNLPVDQIRFAMKANGNPQVLKEIYQSNLGFDAVTLGEVDWIFHNFPNISPKAICYTPNFASIADYVTAFERGVWVTVDNEKILEEHPQVFSGREIILRLDIGLSLGHHPHVRTGGEGSKFGCSRASLEQVAKIAEIYQIQVVGLHAHVGSGIIQPQTWSLIAFELAKSASHFPGVRILNLGGGFGVPDRPTANQLPLNLVKKGLLAFKATAPQFELWIEPGRYLVAESGVLLARVTQLKSKLQKKYIGLNTGMCHLLRPALYGAYHPIYNLSKIDQPVEEEVEVVGQVCESGDVLGSARLLPKTQTGDIFIITNTGAYGEVMSSDYNRIKRPLVKILKSSELSKFN